MSRIAGRFKELGRRHRKAFIPYIVGGDPTLAATVPAMHALVGAGADILELGVPFSDPMAEGPRIQRGHERALAAGASLAQIIEVVAEFRRDDQATPVVLMGYLNPVEAMGTEVFVRTAADSGVDALLVVDMPLEEGVVLRQTLGEADMDVIHLLAPTTGRQRAVQVCAAATGYLYYVSLQGVTGAGHLDVVQVRRRLEVLRGLSKLPLVVGFGIGDASTAAMIAPLADGVVVGSALVDKMGADASIGELCGELATFATGLREALDAPGSFT